jgi:lipoyl(octanoyl) transferase
MTYPDPNRTTELIRAGLIDYQQAWDYQQQLFDEIVAQKMANRQSELQNPTSNYLITCEHPPVYTLGKSGSDENLLLNKEQLKDIGATYHKINRGGDITHHGPGQLVVYPILDLENFFTDIHLYLRNLEEAVIRMLDKLGIEAGRYPGYTGVWIEPDKPSARKICAMGVKCGRWVTMHGIALNVVNDLKYFDHIVPCGIKDKDVTSIQKEIPNQQIDFQQVEQLLLDEIKDIFQIDWK